MAACLREDRRREFARVRLQVDHADLVVGHLLDGGSLSSPTSLDRASGDERDAVRRIDGGSTGGPTMEVQRGSVGTTLGLSGLGEIEDDDAVPPRQASRQRSRPSSSQVTFSSLPTIMEGVSRRAPFPAAQGQRLRPGPHQRLRWHSRPPDPRPPRGGETGWNLARWPCSGKGVMAGLWRPPARNRRRAAGVVTVRARLLDWAATSASPPGAPASRRMRDSCPVNSGIAATLALENPCRARRRKRKRRQAPPMAGGGSANPNALRSLAAQPSEELAAVVGGPTPLSLQRRRRTAVLLKADNLQNQEEPPEVPGDDKLLKASARTRSPCSR